MQSRINKYNKQLMDISDRRVLIANSQNQIIQKYQGNFDTDITATANSATWDSDPQVILLSNEDNCLDMEAKSIETQLNALKNNLEQMEKSQENNIKNGVAKLA